MSIRDTASSLNDITWREERVLRMRFGIPGSDVMSEGVRLNVRLTLTEIAANFGTTRERIRQVQTKGLRKLTEDAMTAAGANLTADMQAKLRSAWRTARGLPRERSMER
jgi:DNA-directed RNA polymerase sigma subunit (sigma70/sigma32)